MKITKLTALLMALAMLLSITACSSTTTEEESDTAETSTADTTEAEETEDAADEEVAEETDEVEENVEETADELTLSGTQNVVIEGFDWGPAVTKVVLSLDQAVDAATVDASAFAVVEQKESFNWAALYDDTLDATEHTVAEAERTVTDAYTCDADGNQVDEASAYVALELYYSPDEGSPYCYDVFTGKNTVCSPYELAISLTDSSALAAEDGTAVTGLAVDAAIDLSAASMPQLEQVDLTGTFTGSDGETLCYGSYEPEDDGELHPLVIWLHGAGEGGTDPSINNLGNKVTALYDEAFQSAMGGAYVLTPQTPTFWLTYDEEGNWADNPGTDSIYLATLMELIEDYVANHEGIDANRIYVGGCSNGGYMTMDLILNYPDYFAAAFPICEAYLDSGITDEQLEGIKDLPVWFVYAANDTTVDPTLYEMPTIERLQAIGADVHTSVFDSVVDTTGLYTTEDGSAYEYMGHWSWLYFFNDQCEEDGVSLWTWLAEQSK